jgi:hypothetical protein
MSSTLQEAPTECSIGEAQRICVAVSVEEETCSGHRYAMTGKSHSVPTKNARILQ